MTATVTELAASLRALRVDGHALVQEYPDDLVAPGGAGIVLVPWPNRVAGARWSLDGADQRLDVTEPATGNASHGLLRNTGYAVVERTQDAVTLAADVFPQHGWPFHLATSVRYALTEDGIQVTHRLVNHSDTRAPVALGAHPYLCVGDVATEHLVVTVVAESCYQVDDRSIPVTTVPVAGTDLDLRSGVRLGEVSLDTAYTDLALVEGARRHRLTAPNGDATELYAEEVFGWVQVFTKPGFPGTTGPGLAVAIEPMTAPADALNSGEGLRWLAPAEQWTLSWGVRRLLA